MREILIRINYFLNEYKRKIVFAIKKEKISINSNTKKIYLFLAADYGNLGDIAITYAQKNFMEQILPDYEVIEIPLSKTHRLIPYLKKKIQKQDIITIVGGGNLTNRYDSIEEARRMVIKSFKRNKIVSFPQTIEFSQDLKGKESMRRSQNIYSSHNQLVIFARENKSYKKMKEIFPNNEVFLVPDIVFSLKNKVEKNKMQSDRVGICLREDKEKLIQFDVKTQIEKEFGKECIETISTYIKDEFDYKNRYKILYELLNKIAKTGVFITDRLHGMLFCYITETPCIVFDNDNHKISETYFMWLKECNYIKFLKEEEAYHINNTIKEMINKEKNNEVDIRQRFNYLEKVLLEDK